MSASVREEPPGWMQPFHAALGALFGAGARLRTHAYDAGWISPKRVTRPVISVGNLMVGGTGKTPFVMLLVELLKKWGYRPGVISRGYRRRGSGLVVVSTEGAPRVGPEKSGDEPALLARMPGVIVVVDKNRVRGAERAIQLGADVLVLDDGFSHRRLMRDLDIVMLDALQPFGNGRLLPEGPLREPPEALKRADLLVLNRTVDTDEAMKDPLPADRPHIEVVVEPVRLKAGLDGPSTPVMSLLGASVGLLSAIARPDRFRRTLEALGARVVHEVRHPDHARLDDDTVARFVSEARVLGAERFLTTEKDAARGTALGPLEVLSIRHRVDQGEAILHEHLRRTLESV